MSSNTRFLRSFLTATLVSSIINCTRAVAETIVVDDQHSGLVWDGEWDQFVNQEEAEDGTLTWTNRTGPTVTFTFTGISVQVFGAFKPVGTWNIQSLYAIDGGSQTPFVPSPLVPQESFRQKFYDSGTLPHGQHTLKVTNLGVQLWIDYFVYDDGGGSGPQSTSSPTAVSIDQIGGTKTTTPATRPSPSSVDVTTSSAFSSGIRSTESGGVPSTSSEATPSGQLSATVLATGLLTPAAISISSIALSLPQSSLLPVSSSLNVTATPGAPDAPHSLAHGMPRTAIVGLAVAISIIAIAVLAIVLQRRRKRFQRAQGKVTVSQYPFTQYFRRSDARPRPRDSQSSDSKTLSVSLRSCRKSPSEEGRLSTDDDVSVVPGTRVEDAAAGLISDAVSENSTPPPSYREFENDDA